MVLEMIEFFFLINFKIVRGCVFFNFLGNCVYVFNMFFGFFWWLLLLSMRMFFFKIGFVGGLKFLGILW